jgi:DNA-binding CsgD family transcriptional regulator
MTESIDARALTQDFEHMPRWVRPYAKTLTSAAGHPRRLKGVFDRSVMPMVIVNDEREHVEGNTAARLVFRLSLLELRQLRIDDLTPARREPALHDAWSRLMQTGYVVGPHQVAAPDGGRFEVTYYALAHALPDRHLITFAPARWPQCELLTSLDSCASPPIAPLTPRELEILDLAATGCTGPMIAAQLVVSAATVRTHFENIYEKLGVRDRAGAVARAMRLGLVH